jgi:transcriptional regulator with XRE-family HTH domain
MVRRMKRQARIARTRAFLRRLRERKALSQSDLAGDCGVTRGAVIRWEALTCEPDAKHRAKYAAALGISVARLGSLIYAAQS